MCPAKIDRTTIVADFIEASLVAYVSLLSIDVVLIAVSTAAKDVLRKSLANSAIRTSQYLSRLRLLSDVDNFLLLRIILAKAFERSLGFLSSRTRKFYILVQLLINAAARRTTKR
jgi:hypothetical protein